ncbi:hypothetical protein CHS0354_020813, partial [Potamilus streckersoni]
MTTPAIALADNTKYTTKDNQPQSMISCCLNYPCVNLPTQNCNKPTSLSPSKSFDVRN